MKCSTPSYTPSMRMDIKTERIEFRIAHSNSDVRNREDDKITYSTGKFSVLLMFLIISRRDLCLLFFF
jgi:hypothetical protein